MASVWAQVDKLKAQHDAEMKATAEVCAPYTRGKPYVDEYGR